MFEVFRQPFSLERVTAIATWLVVTSICLYLMATKSNASVLYLLGTLALCVVYLLLWIAVSQESTTQISRKNRMALSALLFCLIIGIYFVVPYNFIAIYMVIFSAITPYLISIKRAFLLSPVWSVPLYLVYHFYWGYDSALLNAFLFWTFNLFALTMVNASIKERDARLMAEDSNRQLRATQSLLNQAVKQGERVRIARNIHDLLGHHLTALTINLQVASRKTNKDDTELKASIDHCHQLAKLLLSDVREAVSDIRDKGKIDLAASLNSMISMLPNLDVQLDIDEQIQLTNIEVADAIIKCVQETITNTLKHARAKHISIKLSHQDSPNTDLPQSIIHIEMSNDGLIPSKIKDGNGLTGMRERVAALKGSIEFLLNNKRFCTHISIPLAQLD